VTHREPMLHSDSYVTPKFFQCIGPSNDSRRHIEDTYLVFTRCDVVGTWSREYQLSSSYYYYSHSHSHSHSYSPDDSLFFGFFSRWDKICNNFLITFWQFFDQFLTIFDNFLTTFLTTFANFFNFFSFWWW
jgi:hypothetical protein